MSVAVMEPETKHLVTEDYRKKVDYLEQQVRRITHTRPQTLQFAHEYDLRHQALVAMLANPQSTSEQLDTAIQAFGGWLSEQHPLLWRCASIPV